MESLVITLDGPAGSGKSSVAKALASRLGLQFLDTGAMYRALAAYCLDHGLDPGQDAGAAVQLAQRIKMRFNWQTDPPRLLVSDATGERDVTDRLRDADVTHGASVVAAIGPVRQVLVQCQQQIGRDHPRLVTEGRDQGSVVFPDAQVKFYLDAQPAVRARRRALQLIQSGKPADEKAILAQILERDKRDSSRADGPLVCPADALRVDTTSMTLPQVVDFLETHVRQRIQSAEGCRASSAGRGSAG